MGQGMARPECVRPPARPFAFEMQVGDLVRFQMRLCRRGFALSIKGAMLEQTCQTS
jgi:hypothetical protein